MPLLKSKIAGTGSYAPAKVITNFDLEKMVETSDDWITERTGIKERRVTLGEKSWEVAVKAAKEAIKSSGVAPKDIDLVITGTVTPDMLFPSTSCFVQAALGLRPGIAAFDVSAACSGFLFALDTADKYIRTGAVKKALVIGVDVFSRIVDWKDRNTCILFGDGAGAVVLSTTRGKSSIMSSHIHSDGRHWEMLYAGSAIEANPFGKHHGTTHHKPYVKMEGNPLFRMAVKTMEEAIKEALAHNGLNPGDIALFIPHQANIRIINAMKDRLGLPDEKVFLNIDKYGNTSAASIPIALDEAVRQRRVSKGDIILFVSFGGGLTWASTAVRW